MLYVQAYRYTHIIYCTVSLKQLYQSNNPLDVEQLLHTGPSSDGSQLRLCPGWSLPPKVQFAILHLQPSFSLKKVHLRMYLFILKV